uniref:Tudor domain-containing protein n=1 Tax=Phytophthora ramorum TaxID=164328 RepID=H3GFQ9_PHYRM
MTQGRVGKRVRVYWSDEEEWFEGTIQEYDDSQGYYVVYDDGDERWEPNGTPLLVEGEEEAQTAENYGVLRSARDQDRTPEMMEPPASPGSNYEDDYDGTEQDENQQREHDRVVPGAHQDKEPIDGNEVDFDSSYQQEEADQRDEDQLEVKDDPEGNEMFDDRGSGDSEDEESVAESDMPQTFGKSRNNSTGNRRSPASNTSLPSTVPASSADPPTPCGVKIRYVILLPTKKTTVHARMAGFNLSYFHELRLLQPKLRGSNFQETCFSRFSPHQAPAQTSSSGINRRRFEKQVAKDNRSFAKRLEWKDARRTRRSVQAKAQEKKKVTPPQHGARKPDHKASSGINRTKYVQQVAAENKAIGKRLQNILGIDEGARNPEKFSSWAAAEPKNSTNYDYMDRDKVHAQDKRWQRQVELDFIMEKAQTKYQQRSQTVEEVMELQESVRTLKTQVDTLNKSVVRSEILNKKDQHVRDCLLRAAAASGSSTLKASPRQPITLSKSSSRTATQSSSNDVGGGDSSGKHRKEQEWELLTLHRDRLHADKQKLSQELKALNQQELDLDHEIDDQQSKWELAIATQLFHRQMDKRNAVQAQKALQEMKRRQKALELSREEEEQWKCYQAHQELTQVQIAIQILRDERGEEPRRLAATRASSSSSTAVCDYLTKKTEKQKSRS